MTKRLNSINNNPFDYSSDSENDSCIGATDGYGSTGAIGASGSSGASGVIGRITKTFSPLSYETSSKISSKISPNASSGAATPETQISSPTIPPTTSFPAVLSSWMVHPPPPPRLPSPSSTPSNPPPHPSPHPSIMPSSQPLTMRRQDSDEALFHDCISNIENMQELDDEEGRNHLQQCSQHSQYFSVAETEVTGCFSSALLNSSELASESDHHSNRGNNENHEDICETSSLLPKHSKQNGSASDYYNSMTESAESSSHARIDSHDSFTPLESPSAQTKYPFVSSCKQLNSNSNTDNRSDPPNPPLLTVSPLKQALTTWLSPYAHSAKRAGRKFLLLQQDQEREHWREDSSSHGNGHTNHDDANSTYGNVGATCISHEKEIGQQPSRLDNNHHLGRTSHFNNSIDSNEPDGSNDVDNTFDGNDCHDSSNRSSGLRASVVTFDLCNNEMNDSPKQQLQNRTLKHSDNVVQHDIDDHSIDKRLPLHRAISSPALMTTFSEESETHGLKSSSFGSGGGGGVVLEKIDIQGEHNNILILHGNHPQSHPYSPHSAAMHPAGMHPWTKLILLEELGTASSWMVLLLPYASMILAVILDGDSQLKNVVVGPLGGGWSCESFGGYDSGGAENSNDFGVSDDQGKGLDREREDYFPVPFAFLDSNERGGCNYPFELREGEGLLSHDKRVDPDVDSTKSSIVDSRYRYLMSHGHAFTSGVIGDVPPTSQSLHGFATYDKLSNDAVAMVAQGSVYVSSIVFQRQTSERASWDGMGDGIESSDWCPVLISAPKKLDMVCKLNQGTLQRGHQTPSDDPLMDHYHVKQPISWACTSHGIVDAFFSLPNTAVLIGGDLRVEILLSHHKPRKSFLDDDWFSNAGNVMGIQDDDYYFFYHERMEDVEYQSNANVLLSQTNFTNPQEVLGELLEKSFLTLEHESEGYSAAVEGTRIVAMSVTLVFLCFWTWSMGVKHYSIDNHGINHDNNGSVETRGFLYIAQDFWRWLSCCFRSQSNNFCFWWESPWITFPERMYIFLLLCCLLLLQNPLLVYAFFHPWLYSSASFRCAADALAGVGIHGILFFWLCLVHGLRYHTADVARRRFDQLRRVFELRQATNHISPSSDMEDHPWGRVSWYYKQYGDVDGSGALWSSALRLKHDPGSGSFIEFLFPKVVLLAVGVTSAVTAAISRFPITQREGINPALNPDRFGHGSKIYVVSSIIQLAVLQVWGAFILYTSFITGERLRREPFLSTRPAQLSFRILSSILFLGVSFNFSLFFIHAFNGDSELITSNNTENEVFYDTSIGNNGASLDSKADILFDILRRAADKVPYSGTALDIGPGEIFYASACSLVVAYIFLPSSYFQVSKKEQVPSYEMPTQKGEYSRQALLSEKDKRLQGKDKRHVVSLARKTHTWRAFPLPIRAHGLMSQHTIKETLNLIGTFQLDGTFGQHRFKYGRGSIYKGRYVPVFCIELACWLLEASWQAYYSATEYSLNEWAPGRMRLESIGLKLECAIFDNETDTSCYVATNSCDQVDGEEDSIIVIAFRGTASMSNIRTDLTFRQVPLFEKIVSNVPAFSIRPGKQTVIHEDAWDLNKLSPQSIMKGILCPLPNKYASWPASDQESSSRDQLRSNEIQIEKTTPLLLPAVSTGAKAIIRATPIARQALPCVHEGFLFNYSKVRRQIFEAILPVLKRQVDKSVGRCQHADRACLSSEFQPITLPKIYVTGHSMGGSLGQLLALDLASNCEIVIEQPTHDNSNVDDSHHGQRRSSLDDNEDDSSVDSSNVIHDYWLGGKKGMHRNPSATRIRPAIAVYTFGQPRVGNTAFKNTYKQRVPHTFRVVTEGDAFTAMPSVGPCCGGIYIHSGLEVLLDEGCTGNILVGPTVVETLLRFTKVRTNVSAHSLERYRESLESAFGRDELTEYYKGNGGKARHSDLWHNMGNDSLPSWVTSVKRSRDVRS